MNIGLEMASLPMGYYFIYKLFGFTAVLISIGTNFGITALSAKVLDLTQAADERLRALRKKMEDCQVNTERSSPF